MEFSIGDFVAKFGHLIGWTAIVGIAWKLRGAIEEKSTLWNNIDQQTKTTGVEVAEVKEKVGTLESNHMAHMQRDLESISKSNEEAVDALHSIKEGIAVLVDRGNRETIVETKIRHVSPTDVKE